MMLSWHLNSIIYTISTKYLKKAILGQGGEHDHGTNAIVRFITCVRAVANCIIREYRSPIEAILYY